MGYTHYWKFKNPHGNTKNIEALYQKAIKDCNRVIKYYQNCYEKGHYARLSGYSAHVKNYGGINFNGKQGNDCENFCLREHYKQNYVPLYEGGPIGFHFCKTRYYPYDSVVIACLSILKFHLGNYIEVSSDGDREQWVDGVKLANEALRRSKNLILNPIISNPKLKVV